MTNAVDEKSQRKDAAEAGQLKPVNFFQPGNFKYYIHDTAAGYRLQILGHLTDFQVSELNCCWMTARNTLKNRQLVLDLRGVTRVDERGRQWLSGMALEGASYIPESFLRDALAGDCLLRDKNTMKFSLLDRLMSALRGCLASPE